MNFAFKAARLAAALALGAGMAAADPTIIVKYDPGVAFSAADQTQIQNAINFYTSNITSTFTVTIAVGAQTGGGASTSTFSELVDYSTYYAALFADSSGDATDTAAIASLGGFNVNNPVTHTTQIQIRPTLAATLGIGSQVLEPFKGCGDLVADACIRIGDNVLNTSGSPMGSLYGTFQHEFDEVLSTSSALPGGTVPVSLPADPSVADLYRYSAPGVRSFAFNTYTGEPCTGAPAGSPTAYFSINSGTTNLNPYNNCNNGGDYGDWIFDDGLQVQDAFGPDATPSSLNLSSPEVTLLDATGYNFNNGTTATPEPSSFVLLLAGLVAVPVLRRRLGDKPRR